MSERPSMEQVNEWAVRQTERDAAWAARMRAHQERYAEFCKERARRMAEIAEQREAELRQRDETRKAQEAIEAERRAAVEVAAAARQEQLAKEQAAAERRAKAQAKRRAKEQAEREAKMWPAEKLQRSRADWEAVTGDSRLAAQQCAWERHTTVLAMRAAGLTLREIGERYGVSHTRIQQMVAKAERKRRRTHLSPVEQYMQWNAALGMTVGQPTHRIRRAVATLALISGSAAQRDWLHVGTTVGEQVLPVLTVQATGADDAVRLGAGRRLEACHG